MTRDQVDALQYKIVSHTAMRTYHTTAYKAIDVPFTLIWYRRSPAMDEMGKFSKVRSKNWYCLNTKVIKTKEELYKALEEF